LVFVTAISVINIDKTAYERGGGEAYDANSGRPIIYTRVTVR